MKLSYFVKNSSRLAAIEGVRHIKRYYLSKGQLVSVKNPLVINAVHAVKRHSNLLTPYSIKSHYINSFLAASSLSHLLDGWSYLSNAFRAQVSGDSATAAHLAYYAELRSAMSILATEGIGVFDKKHIGAFSSTQFVEYPKNAIIGTSPNQKSKGGFSPTHQFVWEAMAKWTNSAYKPEQDILNIFRVKGLNFNDLTEFFHPSATPFLSSAIIKTWLKDWCLDIKQYRNDRDFRNFVSYRPQRICEFDKQIDFGKVIHELSKFWTAFSPSSSDRFGLLDIYLLRKLFSTIYSKIGSSTSLETLIENAFLQQGISLGNLTNLLNSRHPFEEDHLIFRLASSHENGSMPIMARASLLLRISVGLVSQIFKQGGISKNELSFVWENYGVDQGYWSSGDPIINFNDLWQNVNASISDFEEEVSLSSAPNLSTMLNGNSEPIAHISQIGRACLWGLDF